MSLFEADPVLYEVSEAPNCSDVEIAHAMEQGRKEAHCSDYANEEVFENHSSSGHPFLHETHVEYHHDHPHEDDEDILESSEDYVTVAEGDYDMVEDGLFPLPRDRDLHQGSVVVHTHHSVRSDWAAQLRSVAAEQQRKNIQYHAAMAEQSSLNLSSRRVAIQILIAEARREAQRTGSNRVTKEQWRTIMTDAMEDMTFTDNSALVMKNLSCMCIFVPGRQAAQYGDNPEDRTHRMQRHHSVLEKLQRSNRLFLCEGGGSVEGEREGSL